ncbi:MAG: 1-pyrroline-5-carboxylate dehydrogenase, partial [Pseudonocardiaceae bacterium]
MDAITSVPIPRNEPVRSYPPGSPERASLTRVLAELAAQQTELTMTIGGAQRMAAGEPFDVVEPHRHSHVLGTSAQASAADVADAVRAAMRA